MCRTLRRGGVAAAIALLTACATRPPSGQGGLAPDAQAGRSDPRSPRDARRDADGWRGRDTTAPPEAWRGALAAALRRLGLPPAIGFGEVVVTGAMRPPHAHEGELLDVRAAVMAAKPVELRVAAGVADADGVERGLLAAIPELTRGLARRPSSSALGGQAPRGAAASATTAVLWVETAEPERPSASSDANLLGSARRCADAVLQLEDAARTAASRLTPVFDAVDEALAMEATARGRSIPGRLPAIPSDGGACAASWTLQIETPHAGSDRRHPPIRVVVKPAPGAACGGAGEPSPDQVEAQQRVLDAIPRSWAEQIVRSAALDAVRLRVAHVCTPSRARFTDVDGAALASWLRRVGELVAAPASAGIARRSARDPSVLQPSATLDAPPGTPALELLRAVAEFDEGLAGAPRCVAQPGTGLLRLSLRMSEGQSSSPIDAASVPPAAVRGDAGAAVHVTPSSADVLARGDALASAGAQASGDAEAASATPSERVWYIGRERLWCEGVDRRPP